MRMIKVETFPKSSGSYSILESESKMLLNSVIVNFFSSSDAQPYEPWGQCYHFVNIIEKSYFFSKKFARAGERNRNLYI
jgi:hypothetical protein